MITRQHVYKDALRMAAAQGVSAPEAVRAAAEAPQRQVRAAGSTRSAKGVGALQGGRITTL